VFNGVAIDARWMIIRTLDKNSNETEGKSELLNLLSIPMFLDMAIMILPILVFHFCGWVKNQDDDGQADRLQVWNFEMYCKLVSTSLLVNLSFRVTGIFASVVISLIFAVPFDIVMTKIYAIVLIFFGSFLIDFYMKNTRGKKLVTVSAA